MIIFQMVCQLPFLNSERENEKKEKGKKARKKRNPLYMCDIWKNPKR